MLVRLSGLLQWKEASTAASNDCVVIERCAMTRAALHVVSLQQAQIDVQIP